jgi:hypothetical protein
MAKNKWYERSHWTYQENRGWLIERGIVAFHWSNSQGFHWSIFLRAKWNVLWETSKSFRVDPEVFPNKKRGKNPVRKKARKIIFLTFTSLPIRSFPMTSFPVTSGDATSDQVIPTHDPPQILVRFNMIYYL